MRSQWHSARGEGSTATSAGPPRRTVTRRAPANTMADWTGTSRPVARLSNDLARAASLRDFHR